MFSDKPWHYIVRCNKGYTFEFQKTATDDGPTKTTSGSKNPYLQQDDDEDEEDTAKLTLLATKILLIFKQAAERTNRKNPGFTKACFLELILRIIVAQDKGFKNQSNSATFPFVKLEIQYDWIVAALKSVISGANVTKPTLIETVIAGGEMQQDYHQLSAADGNYQLSEDKN